MSELVSPPVGQPATLWQRVSLTTAVIIGFYVAWAMYEYLLPAWVPTYATINAQYQDRINATQIAIRDLETVQGRMPHIQVKAITTLQADLESIGESYRTSLAKLPEQQVELSKAVITGAGFAGFIAAVLSGLIGWTLEGIAGIGRRPSTSPAPQDTFAPPRRVEVAGSAEALPSPNHSGQ